jgi:hypothetical protein
MNIIKELRLVVYMDKFNDNDRELITLDLPAGEYTVVVEDEYIESDWILNLMIQMKK